MTAEFWVNGRPVSVESHPQRSLLDVLREDLHLTGVKYGCGESQCGACSVLVDGRRLFACQTPVSAAQGKRVRTIEGLADSAGKLHPVQEAFIEENAFQCGFCTPGMIMTAVSLLEENPNPSQEVLLTRMNGNLCRCCAYPNIMRAVQKACEKMKGVE